MNKKKAIDNIHRNYPFVNENLGYIPKWAYLVVGHPKLPPLRFRLSGLQQQRG